MASRQQAEIVGEANVELSLASLCERVGDHETDPRPMARLEALQAAGKLTDG